MRADIVASAVFPDYELIDHTGKRGKLSDLQGPDRMVLVDLIESRRPNGSALLSAAVSVPVLSAI